MRLFFAIELPSDLRAALGRLRPDDDRDYRWVDPAQMHVTLAFLGEQPDSAMPILEQIGAAAVASSAAFRLRLGQPGSFGPKRTPRVLWVGLEGDVHRLLTLHSHLRDELRNARFQVEERGLRPHITLARRRADARGSAIAWPPPATGATVIPVEHLTLFQSRLSPRGATYIPLRHFALCASH